jgi:hypothetical protein
MDSNGQPRCHLCLPRDSRELLLNRIQEYLEVGGLFNPEQMDHDKVRDLIMDCRDQLSLSGPTHGQSA